jgi:pimeloyl-ACP methyl ester carboxylesterase
VDVRQLAVDTLRTVANHFQLPPAPLICNSMGGLWGFWYALAHPQRVSRMVQLGCPALLLDTSAPFFMRLLGVPLFQNLVALQLQPQDVDGALEGLRFQGSRQEDIDRLPPEMARAVYCFFNMPTYLPTWKTLVSSVATLRGARPRYRLEAGALRTIQCPVQFIWGDNDPFGGLDVARRAVEIMSDARLHEMRAGHLPFLDRPQETGRVIRAFLDGARESARFRTTAIGSFRR